MLKLLRRNEITRDFYRDRKFEEVRSFEQLPPHPNILRFFQAWEEMGHLFIQVVKFGETLVLIFLYSDGIVSK